MRSCTFLEQSPYQAIHLQCLTVVYFHQVLIVQNKDTCLLVRRFSVLAHIVNNINLITTNKIFRHNYLRY